MPDAIVVVNRNFETEWFNVKAGKNFIIKRDRCWQANSTYD